MKNGMCSSVGNVLIQISSEITLARPLYLDSALERETTFCLVQDQEIKLRPRKQKWPPVLFRSSEQSTQSTSI